MSKFLTAFTTALFCFSATTWAQGLPGDFAISISTLPATVALNQYATYQVQILNNGPATYPIRSVMATVQAPLNGKIVGFDNIADTAQWEIYSLDSTSNEGGGGNTAVIVNKVAIPDGYQAYPNLKMQAVAILDGNYRVHVANVGYFTDPMGIYGPPPNNAIYGNNDANNDNSQSSLTVSQPLPLDFLAVDAQWQSSDALVSWKVARERHNDYFVVERSFDGKSFTEAGRVKSLGDYTGERSYSYTDKTVKAQTKDRVYYRIRQYDLDGKTTTTEVVSLRVDKSGNSNAYIYPNPAKSTVKFVYENNALQSSSELKVRLTDLHGRLIIEKSMPVTQGKNEISFDVAAMASGSYYLNYSNEVNDIKGSLRIVKE